jgi:hypothetical protein
LGITSTHGHGLSHYNDADNTIQRQAVSWLNRILNTAPKGNDVPSPSTGFFDIEGQPVPLSVAQQDVRAARELIRAAAVRTTALYGIPSNWLSYEVVTISDDEKAYFSFKSVCAFGMSNCGRNRAPMSNR